MTRPIQVPVLVVALLAAVHFLVAKEPEPGSKYEKPRGYSGTGNPAAKTKPMPQKPSFLPTPPATAGNFAAPAGPASDTSTKKYSLQRPNPAGGMPTAPVQNAGPVQFPARPTPTYAPPASLPGTRPVTPQAPLVKPGPTWQPPVVFYPKPAKSKPETGATTLPTPLPKERPPQPTQPGQPWRPVLRPDPPSSQRPGSTTIINNNTTNVTNQVTQVNQWFQKNSWQNQIAINSQNWNGRPWWYQPDYGDWHHGHWHGEYYFRGRDAWLHVDASDCQWLNGLVAWGLGNVLYRSGYQVYANPYYVRPLVVGSTTIDYSRPICVQQSRYAIAYGKNEELADQLRRQALAYFAAARLAFYVDNLDQAYENINRALALVPDDASMHEFRALVLFAAGRYHEAAEVMHSVLAVAPGWDWTTLSGLYRYNDTYVKQLRALEDYVRAKPREPDVRFLLAYHYITIGAAQNAETQYRAVLALRADDRLSTDLLSLVAKREEERSPEQPFAALKADDFQGNWKARRPEGAIELELADGGFRWDYDLVDNDELLRGKFAVAQNMMILATEDGTQMVGAVRMPDRNHFTFQLLGSPASDPGLEFVRR